MNEHKCLDYIELREHEWVEPHGEPCYQAWCECAICGEQFTEKELDQLIADEEQRAGGIRL
jgi:hypothetical protein